MAYFLEIKFFGPNERWQRNPTPFSSEEEADRAGVKFLADHRMDPKMQSEMYNLTRSPRFASGAKSAEYRVVEG